MTRKEAENFIKSLVNIRTSATDKTASACVNLYPTMHNDNKLIKSGTRINWRGKIKRASVDIWDTENNLPDRSPTLWEDILYRDGYRIIPQKITVSTAFSKGEVGWWDNKLYQSKVNSNVFTPTDYPNNWILYK